MDRMFKTTGSHPIIEAMKLLPTIGTATVGELATSVIWLIIILIGLWKRS